MKSKSFRFGSSDDYLSKGQKTVEEGVISPPPPLPVLIGLSHDIYFIYNIQQLWVLINELTCIQLIILRASYDPENDMFVKKERKKVGKEI